MKDRFLRALRHTCFAIDALLGMDVEHLRALMETLDRTNHNAIRVLAFVTRLGNDVGHGVRGI
tara:strand:- start:443 stop:631 length:189 start_codon:yes stop_codon:yes gene_type:complete